MCFYRICAENAEKIRQGDRWCVMQSCMCYYLNAATEQRSSQSVHFVLLSDTKILIYLQLFQNVKNSTKVYPFISYRLLVMEDAQDARSLPVVIIHTVILGATTPLSLAGNLLVCLAFYRKRRLRTITNFYVLSLALADIMVATFLFPFRTVASEMRRWPFSNIHCQFSGFILFQWTLVSLWTLALTSINRYFCVVKPQRYSIYFTWKKTILSIVFIWVFLSSFAITYNIAWSPIFKWQPNRPIVKKSIIARLLRKLFPSSMYVSFFYLCC